jgi:hypothetical protein
VIQELQLLSAVVSVAIDALAHEHSINSSPPLVCITRSA